MDTQAQAIAKELGGEVLRARIEGDMIVVLLVDGRKVRRPRFIAQSALTEWSTIPPADKATFKYIEEAVAEQTAPPASIPNQHKKGKGKHG